MKQQTISGRVFLFQDIGMLVYLACVFVGALIAATSPESLVLQNMLLLLGLFLVSVLASFRARYTAAVTAAFEILAFSVYELYRYFSQGLTIEATAYAWGFVLLGALAGLLLFIREFEATEAANAMLYRQLENRAIVDPLTGLPNLRSMYLTLARTMALSRRHGTQMGLMLVRLRYAGELRRILSEEAYRVLRQRMAALAENTLRLEDRVFSIDEDGSLGIVYFSDEAGAVTIKRRILNAFSAQDAFEGIANRPLRVEVRAAYRQYREEYETNAILFREKVEGELQYDV